MEFEERVERAVAAMQEGRLREALEDIDQALLEEPDSAFLVYLAGLCHFDLKELDRVERRAEALKYLEPESPMGYWLQGIVLIEQDRYDEALPEAERIVDLDPEFADGWALLAASHLGLKHWKEALDAADFGLAIDKEHHQCLRIKAVVSGHLNDRLSEDEALEQLTESHPTDAMARLAAATVHLSRGRFRESQKYYEDAYQLNPSDEWAREGILESIRHRNPLYRWLMRFEAWRERSGIRPGYFLIGFFILNRVLRMTLKANPDLNLFLYPILFLMAFFALWTWFAAPITNLVVMGDSLGRSLLRRSVMAASVVAGVGMVTGLVSVGAGLALDNGFIIGSGFVLLFVTIPAYRAIIARDGGQRFVFHAGVTGLALTLFIAACVLNLMADSALSTAFLSAAGILLVIYMMLVAWLGLGAYEAE